MILIPDSVRSVLVELAKAERVKDKLLEMRKVSGGRVIIDRELGLANAQIQVLVTRLVSILPVEALPNDNRY